MALVIFKYIHSFHGLVKKKFRCTFNNQTEYIVVGSCCAQVIWMKQTFRDHKINLDHIHIKYGNTSAINLSNNPIRHFRIKHIEIRYHFLRDHV